MIIKDRRIVEDSWQLLKAADDGALPAIPASGGIIVPLALWKSERDALVARAGNLGVWLQANDEPEKVADDLTHFALIAIEFKVFSDGRGYSIARALRERFGYRGELRAIGDVLRDQLYYMQRCGFNAFAVRADRSIEDALKALDDFSEGYQASVDQPVPLFRRRLI